MCAAHDTHASCYCVRAIAILLFQDLQCQRLELVIVARVEQDRAVRDRHDLRHQRRHDHEIAGLALWQADFPLAAGVCGVAAAWLLAHAQQRGRMSLVRMARRSVRA